MINRGDLVRVHYVGTLDDGTQFDSSYEHGEMLEFVIGGGHMIVGFERAVAEMEPGERRTVRIEASEAYGEYRDDFVELVPCDLMPGWRQLPIGEPVVIQAQAGQTIQVTCLKVEEGVVYLDHNHFLAGKPLTFDIELVEVIHQGAEAHAAHFEDCGCGCGCHDYEEPAAGESEDGAHEHSCACGCGRH